MQKALGVLTACLMVTLLAGCTPCQNNWAHSRNNGYQHNGYRHHQNQYQNQYREGDYRHLAPSQNYPDYRYPDRYPDRHQGYHNANQVIDEINLYRRHAGLQPLSRDYSLDHRAQRIADEVANYDNGITYMYQGALVSRTTDPRYAVSQWQRSVGRYYISSQQVTRIGVAQAHGRNGVVWVAMFR